MKFSFENLEVYQRSIEFNAAIESILDRKGVTRIIATNYRELPSTSPKAMGDGTRATKGIFSGLPEVLHLSVFL